MGLSLIDVGKTFPGNIVGVEKLNLQVEDGELVTLVGQSGSGKTTTLRLVAGLECPSTGSIGLNGRNVTHVPPHERRVAYVGQRPVLHPRWTVSRHLEFAWALRHGPRLGSWLWCQQFVRGVARDASFRRQRNAVAETWQLDDLLSRRASDLSGGQQQRVALARATLGTPDIYLFDEPFSAVDVRQRATLRSQLRDWQRRVGRPMLYVTHDQAEALAMGDRVAVIRSGRLLQCDTPAQVYCRPRTRAVAEAVGGASTNFLTGCVAEREGAWWLESSCGAVRLGGAESRLDQPQPGRTLTIGLRADELQVAPLATSGQFDGRLIGRVVAVEPQGDSDILRIALGGPRDGQLPAPGTSSQNNAARGEQFWLARVEAWSRWRTGDRVILDWQPSRLLRFEPASGGNLSALHEDE